MSKERIIKALEKEMEEYKKICPKCATKGDYLSAGNLNFVLCEKHQKEKEKEMEDCKIICPNCKKHQKEKELESNKKDINLEIAIINTETQLELNRIDMEISPEDKRYFYWRKQSIIETQLMLLHQLKENKEKKV